MIDTILATRRLFEGWLNILMVTLRVGGRDVEWPLIEAPSGSALLAYDPNRRVAFTVRQTRLAVLQRGHAIFPEPVAGVVDDGDWEETAKREAMEEVGLRIGKIELVGWVWVTPSLSTERVHLYIGEYTTDDRVGGGGGLYEEHEQIDAREEPLDGLWASVQRGDMTDAKLLMTLQALRIRRPDLF